MQTHSPGGEQIDVGSLLKDVLPLDLLQQGESIEEVAEKLIHNGEETSIEAVPADDKSADLNLTVADSSSGENLDVGVGEVPNSAAPEDEQPPSVE